MPPLAQCHHAAGTDSPSDDDDAHLLCMPGGRHRYPRECENKARRTNACEPDPKQQTDLVRPRKQIHEQYAEDIGNEIERAYVRA
jgi:hypothetical protein